MLTIPTRYTKKDIVAGIAGAASVVLQDNTYSYNRIRINEETGAVAVLGSTRFRIAASVDALTSAPVQGSDSVITGFNHWINGLLLIHNKFYNSNGDLVRTLPSSLASGWSGFCLYGNDIDGYFIWHTHVTESARRMYAYDWVLNTVTEMWRLQFQQSGLCVVDTESGEVLVGFNNYTDTVIRRTSDGINWTAESGNVGTYGGWVGNLFQHVYINMAGRAWWDGNRRVVVNSENSHTLFSGYIGGWSSTPLLFYAGKKMLVNGTRLYDIVPK